MRTVPACGLLSLVLVAACQNHGSANAQLTSPSNTPRASSGPSVPPGQWIVSGTVSDLNDPGRRIAGVTYNAWIATQAFSYSYVWATGPHSTDSTGHYELVNVPDGAVVTLQLEAVGYTQQCASPVLTVHGDTTFDATLVSSDRLSASASSVPPSSPGMRTISGTIFESTPNGPRAVSGASVDFEPIEDFGAAFTSTDSQGHYLLCGIPAGEPADLGASIAGQVGYLTVNPRQTTGADIILP